MSLLQRFVELYQEGKELVLLEWTYLLLAVAFFLLAGIVALFNQALGVGVLIIPLVSFVTLTMNIVAWSLIHYVAETMLSESSPRTPKAPKASSSRSKTRAKTSAIVKPKTKSNVLAKSKTKSSTAKSKTNKK